MPTVIDALREEHRNIGRLLDALARQIEVFVRAGDPDYDIIRGAADYFLDFPDRSHHPKEDAIFRRLVEVYPAAANEIGDLAAEHRTVHERAVRFERLVSRLLSDTDLPRSSVVEAAEAFVEAERRHMQLEEERFFPLAQERLAAEDWRQIEAHLTGGDDPLLGGGTEGRFRKIAERLLRWDREGS